MRGTKSSNETGCNIIPQLIKAGLIASVLSIALIVLFAVALQQSWLDDGSIAVVTSVIKVLGAALASFVITKKCKNRAWVYGALAGIVYALMAFPLFLLYNRARGPALNKYIFYGFYPAHLLILWGISCIL